MSIPQPNINANVAPAEPPTQQVNSLSEPAFLFTGVVQYDLSAFNKLGVFSVSNGIMRYVDEKGASVFTINISDALISKQVVPLAFITIEVNGQHYNVMFSRGIDGISKVNSTYEFLQNLKTNPSTQAAQGTPQPQQFTQGVSQSPPVSAQSTDQLTYGALPKTNTLAILSLILAFLFFPIGFILGIVALSKVKKSGEGGRGFAIAAIITSIIFGIFTVIWIVAVVFIYPTISKSASTGGHKSSGILQQTNNPNNYVQPTVPNFTN